MAIIGKGVTYDTGGLDIKTAMMARMYGDKGGACAVIGALMACKELEIKKNIVFACAFAENAVGPDSYKPGDIITSMKGLTVEIENTDAEGRLVMADTMTYVQRNYKPEKVVYIATLTGSVAMALGKTTAGFFAPSDEFASDIKKAAEQSFEDFWQLPLNDEHRNAVKGSFGGDITNCAKERFGGACVAAAFLEHFVEEDRPWAHLDIAGPAIFNEAEQQGFGAKLLTYLINNL